MDPSENRSTNNFFHSDAYYIRVDLTTTELLPMAIDVPMISMNPPRVAIHLSGMALELHLVTMNLALLNSGLAPIIFYFLLLSL